MNRNERFFIEARKAIEHYGSLPLPKLIGAVTIAQGRNAGTFSILETCAECEIIPLLSASIRREGREGT